MKINIGGDRIGSGNKMTTELKNYHRSTHNLSRSWRSTMAPGVLVPFFVEPALNGDSFEIDLNAMVRTIPTQGPLMGSFKLQMDVFQCPIRLYQGLLHNNANNIGMKMEQVKLPKIKYSINADTTENVNNRAETNKTSLQKYIGISGVAFAESEINEIEREFNAIPFLAYYEIFKNYYANKQEENAYVISGGIENNNAQFSTDLADSMFIGTANNEYKDFPSTDNTTTNCSFVFSDALEQGQIATGTCFIKGEGLDTSDYKIVLIRSGQETEYYYTRGNVKPNEETTIKIGGKNYKILITNTQISIKTPFMNWDDDLSIRIDETPRADAEISLNEFPLENIDWMRNEILSNTSLDQSYIIDKDFRLPYKYLTGVTSEEIPYHKFTMNGLCVKTYQADLFNSWINTEWIDGENGINAITTIDTTDGLKLDTLNLAQKVYNMLNRIAVSGGTYEDWQEAVYTQKAIRHAESPIYCGGMESEVVFDEVIQTATTSEENKLGTIGGRGTLNGKRGGYLDIKINEPSFIIGIVSLTPRIDYTQGNKWFLTDLFSMNDLHKPALDGIGFQDVMEEQAAWWGTHYNEDSELVRHTIGKVPAWINYMTAFDECFGDFAEQESKNFMVLARNYEQDPETGFTKDLTTYIEPEKFNYAFAYQELAAQNFWVQIYSKVTARRIMSAKVIPNL